MQVVLWHGEAVAGVRGPVRVAVGVRVAEGAGVEERERRGLEGEWPALGG